MRLAFPGLLAAIAEGVTIVTPTPTLASVALEQFNRHQLANGNTAWQRPNIYSLDAWMTNCWQDARFQIANPPALLSLSQERELWRQIIESSRPDLFDLRAMASLAQRAARILAEYQIPVEGQAWSEHADAKEFLRWHQTFEKRLKAENWITRAHLWRLLPTCLGKGNVNTRRVAFVALSSISPGLKALSRAIGESVENVGIGYRNQAARANALPFDSTAGEIEYVARSVRRLLETEQMPSIGILVADLASHTHDVSRVLNQVLYPRADFGNHVHIQTSDWINHPLISNALLILQLARPRVTLSSAGAMLRSPFIDGAQKERSLRAIADSKLRRIRELDFAQSEIERAAWDCPILFQILRSIAKLKEKLTPSMRLSAWSAVFSDILEAAKWPAIEQISDLEQQALDTWNTALSELASLGLVSPQVGLHQAISHLESILARPSEIGGWSSPVQVMEANSSEAIEFQHSFILNASEEAWPARISLSPLIPYGLQRLHQVPASDPESVTDERARKTDALFRSGQTVVVTHSGHLARALRPSVQVGAADSSAIWPGFIGAELYAAAELTTQDDSHAPALSSDQIISGGANLIKAQSACPFMAFATYRLNARGEDEPSIGFDALERGNCAHVALESIWKELQSQTNLKALSSDELAALVQKHVAQAVKKDAALGPIHELTAIAERERLNKVVFEWLEIDAGRSTSFVVEKLEHERDVEFAGLKLKLRLDRIDRLADGQLVLIDYKSGIQAANKLEGHRPAEPQLLVYAAAMDEPIDGLYFGELRNRSVRAVGHGGRKHFGKGITVEHVHDWSEFLSDSKDTVHRLAGEFLRGQAGVSPLPKACDFCRIKPMCRVNSSSTKEDEPE